MDACIALLGELNYLAVLAATLISMFLGALWYSPILFGNNWMKLMGFTEEQLKKEGSAKEMAVSVFTSFIEALMLASLILMTGTKTFFSGVHLGAMIGIGIIAMVNLSNAMFNRVPLKLWGINSGYRIVYYMINGGILAIW